jgi:hypothetical protein
MFERRLNELKQRQLEIRLRNMELRAALRSESRTLTRPVGWLSLAASALGVAGLVAGLRKRRGLRLLAWSRLGLRLARIWFSASARPSGPPASPPSSSAPPNP